MISDPSHGTGKWYLVKPLALASMAVGAHGLIVEVHPNPDQALSDGPQSLTLASFSDMMDGLRKLAEPQGKTVQDTQTPVPAGIRAGVAV